MTAVRLKGMIYNCLSK